MDRSNAKMGHLDLRLPHCDVYEDFALRSRTV
jgi:hypothetical protein